MPPDKQMKIAGETDYFYAPLANRLDLYGVKSELENLSMKYRCPHEYSEMEQKWRSTGKNVMPSSMNGPINCVIIWMMNGIVTDVYQVPFCLQHLEKDDEFGQWLPDISVISMWSRSSSDYGGPHWNRCLEIYSILTDCCKELPASIHNYIDSPKEKRLSAFSSENLGCPWGMGRGSHLIRQNDL